MQDEEPGLSVGQKGQDPGGEMPHDFYERLMSAKERARGDSTRVRERGVNVPPSPAADINEQVRRDRVISEQSDVLRSSLEQARRYVYLTQAILIASLVIASIFSLASGLVLIGVLATGAEWQTVGITGALGVVSIITLFLLAYRPGGTHRLALTQLAQLETARAYLDQIFNVWDKFFDSRTDAGVNITTDEVSVAMASLTEACGRIFKDAASQGSPGRSAG